MYIQASREYNQRDDKYSWKLGDRRKFYIRFKSYEKNDNTYRPNQGNSELFDLALSDNPPEIRAKKLPVELPKNNAIEQVKLEAA